MPGATKRLLGVVKAIAYAADSSTEVPFSGGTATFLDNAYNSSLSLSSDEVEVTAFGDFPFRKNELGFMTVTASLSMRNKVVEDALSPDLKFLEDAAFQRTIVRLAFLDSRQSAKPNGYIFSMYVNSITDDSEFASAQDKQFSFTIADGAIPPQRILAGVVVNFDGTPVNGGGG